MSKMPSCQNSEQKKFKECIFFNQALPFVQFYMAGSLNDYVLIGPNLLQACLLDIGFECISQKLIFNKQITHKLSIFSSRGFCKGCYGWDIFVMFGTGKNFSKGEEIFS